MSLPSDAPAWTDIVLVVMGVALLAGLSYGWMSSVPLRVAGSVGSIIAAAILLGGMFWNP